MFETHPARTRANTSVKAAIPKNQFFFAIFFSSNNPNVFLPPLPKRHLPRDQCYSSGDFCLLLSAAFPLKLPRRTKAVQIANPGDRTGNDELRSRYSPQRLRRVIVHLTGQM
jgi:hypothetical protein